MGKDCQASCPALGHVCGHLRLINVRLIKYHIPGFLYPMLYHLIMTSELILPGGVLVTCSRCQDCRVQASSCLYYTSGNSEGIIRCC